MKPTRPVSSHPPRKRKQQSSQSSVVEPLFGALFDHTPDGILVVDAESGRLLSANPAMCRMVGRPIEELVELRAEDIHPPDAHPRLHAEFQRLKKPDSPVTFSLPVQRRDGTVFLAEISASRFEMDGHGLLIGMYRGIASRQKAEERIHLQHELMLALAGASRLDEGLQLCLEAALKADGLTCGGIYLLDPQSDALVLRVHAGLSAEFVKAVARFESSCFHHRLCAAGQPVYAECSDLPLDQSRIELEEGLQAIAVLPVFNQGRLLGSLNLASHTHKEILSSTRIALETIAASAGQAIARLQAQEHLRERENNFRTLFQTIDELVFVATPEGHLRYANPAVECKLGYDMGQLDRLEVADLHPPAMRTEAGAILAAVLRGERQTCPLPLMRKDGSLLPVETRVWRGQWNGDDCLFGLCKDLSAEQEAEQRFESLFRHNPLPMALISLSDRRFTDVNDAWLGTLGYERREVLGKTAVELDLFPDGDQYRQVVSRLLETGTLNECELQIRARDRSLRHGLLSGELLHSHGKSLALIIMVDVTERIQGATDLRESERRLATLTANLPGMAYRCENTPDWAMLFVSEGCAGLTGHTAAHLMSNQPAYGSLIHPEDAAAVWSGVEDAVQHQGPFELTYRIRTADGQVKWVWERGRGIPDEQGEVLFLEGFISDITQRVQMEQERELALAKYQTLFDCLPLGITVSDRAGRIMESNRLAEQLLGLPAQQQQSRQIDGAEWRIIRPDRSPMPSEEFASVIALREGRVVRDVEMGIVKSSTETQWITVTAAPVSLPDVGVVIAYSDIGQRKHTEALLRESLLFRREAEKIARIGAWKTSPAIDYLYWTEGIYEILEAPLDYRPGLRDGLQVYDPESITMLQAALHEALERGSPFVLEAGVTTLTGKHLWAEVRGLGRVEEGGQAYAMGTFQDVTLRKQTEARLARDKMRTEFLLQLHQRAPQMSDAELYDHVLDRAVQLTESVIGFFHQVSEDEASIILTTWNQEARKHCTAAFNTHYPLKDAGNWVDCVREKRPVVYNDYANSPHQGGLPEGHNPLRRFMSIPVINNGRVQIIFGVGNKASDYTDDDVVQLQVVANELHKIMVQRSAENQLRQLSRAVEQSPVSVIITDTEGAIEYVNARFTQVSGYTLEDVRGKNPRVLKSDEMPPEHYRRLWRTIRSGAPWQGELRSRKKNGEVHWELASISPITDGTGNMTHFVAVKEDITERKRLEAQLRQSQKLEAIGQLAGGVAHDFNNILAAIMMHLGLLQLNDSLDAETRQALTDLDAEARRAAGLTRQLLMFSRRSVLTIRPLDLNDTVANLLRMLTRLIGENIQLNFESSSHLPSVKADAGMLEQVLLNLVVNARDAMPEGGRITINTSSVEFVAADVAGQSERRPGRFVCLSVADTGSGMDDTTLRRIFEPFFTTKEAGRGTGLGLATVHGIVAQHQGWIEVESALNQGTTFRILLPASVQAAEQSTEAADSQPLPHGQETILLVEDEARVRQMVGRSLRALGYEVHEAANGQEAMQLWQTHGAEIDLLFTDMVMPEGMTGLELTERLQSLKPGLKSIISSGYSAEIVQAGVPDKAGVLYLPKPYETRRLADTVRKCLHKES